MRESVTKVQARPQRTKRRTRHDPPPNSTTGVVLAASPPSGRHGTPSRQSEPRSALLAMAPFSNLASRPNALYRLKSSNFNDCDCTRCRMSVVGPRTCVLNPAALEANCTTKIVTSCSVRKSSNAVDDQTSVTFVWIRASHGCSPI